MKAKLLLIIGFIMSVVNLSGCVVIATNPNSHQSDSGSDFNQIIEGWISKINNREWFD